MMIKRVDENSITCRISKEELEEMGLALDDLISNREKARGLLKEVLEEAKTRVNFYADSNQLNVQMSVLPDGDVTLTIFDDQKSAIAAMLRQYKELLHQQMEDDPDSNLLSPDPSRDEVEVPLPETLSKKNGSSILTKLNSAETKELLDQLEDDDPVMLPLTVSFDNLEDVMSLCRQISPWNPMAKSDLYKFQDRYYLSITLTEHKISMARSVFALAEYSGRAEKRSYVLPFLQEHGRLLCAGNALEALARI